MSIISASRLDRFVEAHDYNLQSYAALRAKVINTIHHCARFTRNRRAEKYLLLDSSWDYHTSRP